MTTLGMAIIIFEKNPWDPTFAKGQERIGVKAAWRRFQPGGLSNQAGVDLVMGEGQSPAVEHHAAMQAYQAKAVKLGEI